MITSSSSPTWPSTQQEHSVHHAHLQAPSVDLWRDDLQSGGIPRTTTPTEEEVSGAAGNELQLERGWKLLMTHFTRAQVGVCETQFGTVGLWVRCVVTLHFVRHTAHPHVAIWAKHTA